MSIRFFRCPLCGTQDYGTYVLGDGRTVCDTCGELALLAADGPVTIDTFSWSVEEGDPGSPCVFTAVPPLVFALTVVSSSGSDSWIRVEEVRSKGHKPLLGEFSSPYWSTLVELQEDLERDLAWNYWELADTAEDQRTSEQKKRWKDFHTRLHVDLSVPGQSREEA